MDIAPLRAAAPPGVRFVERFVTDRGAAGVLRARRRRRAALPRDRPVRRALHRAGVRPPARAERRRRLPGGRARGRGRARAAGRRGARCTRRCARLLDDPAARSALGDARRGDRARALRLGRRSPAPTWTSTTPALTLRDSTPDDRAEGRVLDVRRAARLHAGGLPARARGARPVARPAPGARACRAGRRAACEPRDRRPPRRPGDRGQGPQRARARLAARAPGDRRRLRRVARRHARAGARGRRRPRARARRAGGKVRAQDAGRRCRRRRAAS